MTNPTGPSHEGQRELILSGAAELFARRGYQGTSMNDVSEMCGLAKSTLYHYYRDKNELLASIADAHVSRLVELVESVEQDPLVTPAKRLEALITRFLHAYAQAQNAHRVLTEDVKFLPLPDRDRILDKERRVVQSFADAVAVLRPDMQSAGLSKPVAMLLFGMLNWMFTWLRPQGSLTHASIAPLVCDLFFRGLPGVVVPPQG